MQHAATYVVGGKKGWAGVKGWTADLSPNDVLVFKWGNRALDGLFGPKHSVAIPKSLASLNTCNTKDVEKMVVKPTRKAKKSYTLGPINPPRFFSTVGKDCKNGIKFSLGL
ncbi:unnamed protein product [Closterium sp. NIES-64]|nr:unnamed protein product [Closterium sp. NIES-64]